MFEAACSHRVAALPASQGLSTQQIIDRLVATTGDLGVPRRDPLYGDGRATAARAVTG